MYNYANKTQDFVDMWCSKFNLPTLWVKIGNNNSLSKLGGILPKSHTMIIWRNNIPNRATLVNVMLHELVHWLLYWRYKDSRYKNEYLVTGITRCLLKEYYPSYLIKY